MAFESSFNLSNSLGLPRACSTVALRSPVLHPFLQGIKIESLRKSPSDTFQSLESQSSGRNPEARVSDRRPVWVLPLLPTVVSPSQPSHTALILAWLSHLKCQSRDLGPPFSSILQRVAPALIQRFLPANCIQLLLVSHFDDRNFSPVSNLTINIFVPRNVHTSDFFSGRK